MSSSSLQAQFEAAAETARTDLPSSLPNDTKGKLYALYKQATVGDVQGERPSLFSPTARVKWDHWNDYKGTTQDHAKQQYIDFVQELQAKK